MIPRVPWKPSANEFGALLSKTPVQKFDPSQPRDEDGKWTSGGRSFTSEEGYQWHETGPVAEWAKALPYEDHRAIGDYSGFSYADINGTLRGDKPATKLFDEYEATPEIKAFLRSHPITVNEVTDPEAISGSGRT